MTKPMNDADHSASSGLAVDSPGNGQVPVIPAPALVTPTLDTWSVSSGAAVSGPVAVLNVLQLFIADVASDAGIQLAVAAPDRESVAIRVELTTEGLAELPAAVGLRADGLELEHADERYGVEVNATGVRVFGATPEAIHRGLTTLRQLITAAAASSTGTAVVAGVRILDAPRYSWRGLSVDVARTFHGVDTIQRVLDMCSLYKLNVLHLHLTDDQGWRFEVPNWPLLTEVGGAGALGDRPGGFYTPADIAALADYAAARFITLVPEVDLPGHAAAIFRAYPELAPEPIEGADDAKALGIQIGTLDLDRGRTRDLVRDALAAAANQFPASAWIHVGGDEAFGMADTAHAEFVEFSFATVRGLGRRAVGWQEAVRAEVGSDDLIQYWIDPGQLEAVLAPGGLAEQLHLPDSLTHLLGHMMRQSHGDLARVVAKGPAVLLSPNDCLYLDRRHAEPSAVDAQEAQRARLGNPFYPPARLRDFIECDLAANRPGLDEQRIAGIEAAIWCETIADRDDLEFLLLPRLPGVGERAWSAAPTDWDTYVPRLAAASRAWDRRGWNWFRSAEIDWSR